MSSVDFDEVAGGLGFTEGPLWTIDGQVRLVSVSRGLIYEVDPGTGEAVEVAEPGGNPTGLCQDAEGRIWIAQGGRHTRTRSEREVGPSIQCLHDGVVEDVATDGLTAPNDCVVGPDGLVWFTDPAGSPLEAEGLGGAVCTLDRESGEVVVRLEGIRYPNGLAFAPDARTLYVAATGTREILAFDVRGSEASPAGVLAALPDGHPDGMAVGPDGHLYVAGTDADAVFVVDLDGTPRGRLGFPEKSFPTNVCFGGADHATLFATAVSGGRLWARTVG